METDSTGPEGVGLIACYILAILILASLIELGFFLYSYFTADEVKCNFIFCEFSKTRQTSIVNQTCYQNGVMINCSETVDIDKIMREAGLE